MTEETIEEPEAPAQLDFPVVGIGASAGGLEAVTSMFKNIEGGTGIAFVLVMHLDPDHESMMAELLSSKTQISVRQIADKDLLEPDCLHVIPPGASLHIEDQRFRLEAFSEPRGLRRPIDSFFSSLAHVQGEKAACVVLSGTGGDGTAGLRVIKEFGGITAVQSPEEARYDGMPFSAIGTKMVDFTLPAADIAPRIKAFFDGADKSRFPENDRAAERVLRDIFAILKQTVGIDFSGYKRSTLLRRLNRRLQLLEIGNVGQYTARLLEDKEEQIELSQDFLINVTSFFRDRENFELLRQSVIIPMIEHADVSDEIRIWVPGCSSGQEAYSLAMMVDETCTELQRRPLIQIFATDIDEPMIDQARRGLYPVSILSEIPQRYQEAYTIGHDERFEILPRIREMVRFSLHNIIQDPPFSKVDLISCRNMLIYLGDQLQEGVLPLLHFSLRPGGHLFLGTSESVTRRNDLFISLDQRARIFRRNDAAKRVPINLPLGISSGEGSAGRGIQRMSQELDFPRHQSLDATNITIYEDYAPPFVRVTIDGRIIDSSGDLSLFMMSRPGDDRSLDSLAREGVYEVVAPLVKDAAASGERQAMKDVEVSSPFGMQRTDIVAHPMKDETVALIFLVKDRLQPIIDQFAVKPVTRDRQIAALQEDLQKTRLQLKAKVEEIETANEELKSSNEEMMSMNEELQSANEELTTANEELKNKIDELTLANADLDNFLQSADLAMIVLDRGMKIRHVTDAARRMVPLMRSDEGRQLSEFNIAFDNVDVITEVKKVIDTGVSYSITTDANQHGQSYFLRITPYFFSDGAVEGASLTLVNISQDVQLRQDLSLQSEKLHLAMQAAKMGSWDTDLATETVEVDAMAAEMAGLPGSGVYDRDTFFANVVPEDAAEMAKVRSKALSKNESYSHVVRIAGPDGIMRWAHIHAQPYLTASGERRKSGLWLDVSELMSLQDDLRRQRDRLQMAMDIGAMGAWDLDPQTWAATLDAEAAKIAGLDGPGTYAPNEHTKLIVPEDLAELQHLRDEAVKNKTGYSATVRFVVEGEKPRWGRFHASPTFVDGKVTRFFGVVIDVTESMMLQREIEIERDRLRLAMRAGRMGLAELDIETNQVTVDPVLAEQFELPSPGTIAFEELTANFEAEDIPLVEESLNRAIDHGEEYEIDFRVKGDGLRWIRTRGFPYVSEDGKRKVVGPTIDVTAEKRQVMLLDEMSHRVKNLFAVISGLIAAAPKESEETALMANDLVERIVALGRIYDLARKDIFTSQLDLKEIFSSILEPHRSSQKVTLEGPEILVPADLINTFTLIIHELATNAAKYGALSQPKGALAVKWHLNKDGKAEIAWTEKSAGFSEPEAHTGFGSFLVESGVRQLRGAIGRTYSDKGAQIKLSVQLSD